MLPPQWEHDFDKSAILAKPLEEEFLGAILEPKIDENRIVCKTYVQQEKKFDKSLLNNRT